MKLKNLRNYDSVSWNGADEDLCVVWAQCEAQESEKFWQCVLKGRCENWVIPWKNICRSKLQSNNAGFFVQTIAASAWVIRESAKATLTLKSKNLFFCLSRQDSSKFCQRKSTSSVTSRIRAVTKERTLNGLWVRWMDAMQSRWAVTLPLFTKRLQKSDEKALSKIGTRRYRVSGWRKSVRRKALWDANDWWSCEQDAEVSG